MFLVIFESITLRSCAEISAKFYSSLQTILYTQPGFVSEVPYAFPFDGEKGVLVANFAAEAAEDHWRLQHDHLKIESKARNDVLQTTG